MNRVARKQRTFLSRSSRGWEVPGHGRPRRLGVWCGPLPHRGPFPCHTVGGAGAWHLGVRISTRESGGWGGHGHSDYSASHACTSVTPMPLEARGGGGPVKCSTARRVCWGGSLRVGRCRSLCSLAHSPQIPLDSAVTAWSAVHPFDPGFVRAALGARRPPALWPQPPRAARAAFPGPGPSRSHGLDTCISARAWRPGSGPCHGGRFLWAQAGFGHRSAVCPEVRAIQPCV